MYFRNELVHKIISDVNVVVFDFNGLIIDDEPVQLKATRQALSQYGIEITEEDWRCYCVGRKPMEFIPKLLNKEVSIDEFRTIVRLKSQAYVAIASDVFDDLVTEGTTDLLAYCAKAGIEIALATSTPQAELESLRERTGSALRDHR